MRPGAASPSPRRPAKQIRLDRGRLLLGGGSRTLWPSPVMAAASRTRKHQGGPQRGRAPQKNRIRVEVCATTPTSTLSIIIILHGGLGGVVPPKQSTSGAGQTFHRTVGTQSPGRMDSLLHLRQTTEAGGERGVLGVDACH